MWKTFGRGVAFGLVIGAVGCTIEERTDLSATAQESTRRVVIQPEGVARLPVFSSAIRSAPCRMRMLRSVMT